MSGRNYHIQDYLRIHCKFIYVSNGKFLNWICLSILILGVFRTKQVNEPFFNIEESYLIEKISWKNKYLQLIFCSDWSKL